MSDAVDETSFCGEFLNECPDVLESGLVFVGFLAIRDPLRDDVKDAIEQCRRAGIEVKMITGDNVETVHFPCGSSLVSYVVPHEDGRDVEAILVGREGAVGGVVSQGFLPAYTRIAVKFGGPFTRIPIGRLEAAKANSLTLRNVFARYADCMLAQMFQSTACNAIHSIEQRTAKWIISAMERADGDNVVPLTHEQLATLLGVGRSYASRVIQVFKAEGVLETRRGSILVHNYEGLKVRSCLCNESVKNHFEEVLRGVYPTEEKMTG